jgi:hypothetical protein
MTHEYYIRPLRECKQKIDNAMLFCSLRRRNASVVRTLIDLSMQLFG